MPENENIQMNVEEENNNSNQQQNQEQQPQNVNVNVSLLKNLNSLMEIVISRGVFRPNELSSVGKVYDDLNKLLNQ